MFTEYIRGMVFSIKPVPYKPGVVIPDLAVYNEMQRHVQIGLTMAVTQLDKDIKEVTEQIQLIDSGE